MLQLLHVLFHALQPLLIPVCFLSAWTLVFLIGWNTWAAAKGGVATVKRLHQIPCANCQFFTHNYLLKCTVRPSQALSEAAIDCPDYWPKDRRV